MRTPLALCAMLAVSLFAQGQAQRQPRILIDASRDAGVWWSTGCGWCQQRHQGYALTDYLRRRRAEVEELPQGSMVTDEVLSGRDLVIRAGAYGGYSDIKVTVLGGAYPAGEVAAYREYVAAGGRLLLLSEYRRPDSKDSLAESFGIRFVGMSRGENRIARFVSHPITRNVRLVDYLVGSGVVAPADHMTMLGFLSRGTYLDMNGDGRKDAADPDGVGVLGLLHHGKGVVVFLGDTNTLQRVPQPLTDNLFAFLLNSR